MAQNSIPVDLFNPGQVFACLGFLEAAEVLLGDAEGGFDWSDGGARFHLQSDKSDHPARSVIDFLLGAKVCSISPADSLSTEKWAVSTMTLRDNDPFPCEIPDSPATLPALLVGEGSKHVPLNYWGDSTQRDNVKFWAGAGGYPGAALARDALELIRKSDYSNERIFDVPAPQSSSFRFDWRRDYIAMDTGFAINDHGDITMVGYPLVEIMAAIGVSHARPQRMSKLHYRYGVIASGSKERLLPAALLRAALGCADLPFPQRTFSMRLDWPGQEGQARCIADVIEEPRK